MVVLRLDDVIAFAGLDGVLPGVAKGQVGVGTDKVVTIAPIEQVTAPAAVEGVVARTTVELVVAIRTRVDRGVPGQVIIAIATQEGVIARLPIEVVFLLGPLQFVGLRWCRNRRR